MDELNFSEECLPNTTPVKKRKPWIIVLWICLLAAGLALAAYCGYTNGHESGYASGEATGYESGRSVGRQLGYLKGYKAGENAGYSSGYTDGYDDAQNSTSTSSYAYNDTDYVDYTVYITETGSKYHRWGCQYLRESCYYTTLSSAISRGYTACSVCDP